ncbi:hypothetical protein Q1695_007284 [Nippostrongylus brasiliensis]|nr:hypothetical protein Q1695_007284 [Nippostrongylus brasiliensis]
MLALLERSALSSIVLRHRVVLLSARPFGDRISDAYKSASLRKQPQSGVEGGGYATRVSFDQQMKSQRSMAADSNTGVQPTAMQKWFLIITRLYDNRADIPQYVASGTMDRMHDRMRVVFIFVAVAIFFTLFYIAESLNAKRIARDRDAGVVVKSM